MRGRKPKTNVVHLKTGNPGKREQKKHLDSDGVIAKPQGLSEAAQLIWNDVVLFLKEKGAIDRLDAFGVEVFANTYARKRQAEEVIAKNGTTYETHTRNGTMIRVRPEVKIIEACEKQIIRLLGEYGMTPASRTRLPDPRQGELFGNPFNGL